MTYGEVETSLKLELDEQLGDGHGARAAVDGHLLALLTGHFALGHEGDVFGQLRLDRLDVHRGQVCEHNSSERPNIIRSKAKEDRPSTMKLYRYNER